MSKARHNRAGAGAEAEHALMLEVQLDSGRGTVILIRVLSTMSGIIIPFPLRVIVLSLVMDVFRISSEWLMHQPRCAQEI
jgi:hypothetical protein